MARNDDGVAAGEDAGTGLTEREAGSSSTANDGSSSSDAGATCGTQNKPCDSKTVIPGGAFFRFYDGIDLTAKTFPATVHSFVFGTFEVSVQRFSRFVQAVDAGWRPEAGAGRHVYINDGLGLVDVNSTSYERGWSAAWSDSLPNSYGAWTAALGCGDPDLLDASKQQQPISCVTWFEAYAFCIWDGGFLPSEAEWMFAAQGGDQQRQYPWSSGDSVPASADCSHANFFSPETGIAPCPGHTINVGSDSPQGDAPWGQADMAGNVAEWVLDWASVPANPCDNCAALTSASNARAVHGGGFDSADIDSAYTDIGGPSSRYADIGFRCAYAPH